jgi:hypothetical protein
VSILLCHSRLYHSPSFLIRGCLPLRLLQPAFCLRLSLLSTLSRRDVYRGAIRCASSFLCEERHDADLFCYDRMNSASPFSLSDSLRCLCSHVACLAPFGCSNHGRSMMFLTEFGSTLLSLRHFCAYQACAVRDPGRVLTFDEKISDLRQLPLVHVA